MNPRWVSYRVSLCVLAAFSACSDDKKREPGEPTPFEIYQSQRHIQGKDRGPLGPVPPSASVGTGNNDHDFLRAISDHDKNVIVLSDAALEWNQRPEMQDVIRRIEERHGHDLDIITALLRNSYKDRYVSQPTASTRSTADVLRRPESDHRRVFLDAALMAEEDASRLVDAYLPKAKRSDVRGLAAKLKRGQANDILALKERLASMENP